jgi:hypothetical protein
VKVREVSVEYGRTVNRGNYESERLTVGFTATVDEGEDVAYAVAQLYEECREQLEGRLGWDEPYRPSDRQEEP